MRIIIIVICILILFVSLLFSENIREPFCQKEFVNLVLYSESEHYNQMYEITRKYYSTFKNVKTIYYTFDESLREPAILRGDILYIQGKNTFIPGILDKTVKAMEYAAANYQFDYLVRTNISTIVNFDKLQDYLCDKPMDYGGVRFLVDSIEPTYGITDATYFGTEYASGICIIMSQRTIDIILREQGNLDTSVIDDVALGILVKQLGIPTSYLSENTYLFLENVEDIRSTHMIFRNHNGDRAKDVENMRRSVSVL